jgi:hypothetical protein
VITSLMTCQPPVASVVIGDIRDSAFRERAVHMTTKLVAAIHHMVGGMRERRTARPARRVWQASLAEMRRGQWHQLHDS